MTVQVTRLLFVAPAVPGPTGSGLRMRGWQFLEGLARRHRVTLVAGSPGFPDDAEADLGRVRPLVEDALLLRFGAATRVRRLAARLTAGHASDWVEPGLAMRWRLARLGRSGFDAVHVFRLYMLPVAAAALGKGNAAPIQLDLDDWESETRLSFARLADREEPARAARFRKEAAALVEKEREWLPRVARVLVASSDDASALAERHGLRNVVTVGNAVSVPPEPPPPSSTEPPELLFVGSLGYYPNQDAVRFLMDEVLPALRGRRVRLVVAGPAPPPALKARLLSEPEVTWVDSPARMEPLYERARIVLAPIRAGGGTRVKVLEAFARARPLVATGLAVAGLGVVPGVHYRHAEEPCEWAAAVAALLDTPTVGTRLVEAAFSFVRGRSHEIAVRSIADLAWTVS